MGEQQPLVLVVDDYADAREMYCEYLQLSGFRVTEASDGAEALAQAFAQIPDVVLMDLSLPTMDGVEATRQLKLDVRTRGVPVIALTGHSISSLAGGFAGTGCDSFVTKPCLPEALVAEVRRVLGKRAHERLP